jgi:hypothetical protein
MKNIIYVVLVALLTTMFSVALPSMAVSSETLDGKQFVAIVDGEEDILTFHDGTFHSSSCDEHGFGPGEYTSQQTEDGISFEAKTTSADNGQMVWTGKVKDDKIVGSYHWTKEGMLDTKERTENFEGSMKK